MARLTKTSYCKTCGDPYQKTIRAGGFESSTVNCPDCRRKAREKRMGGGGGRDGLTREEMQYISQRFRCNDCGKVMDRSEGRQHRRETGHTNVSRL